ncbi:hypothetical protein NDU88_001342 [Pleurodeles waltl]|uniref:Uncharacterized protein n=1 Tax=Pleurodeles waltl TaxID=8319 RepID=A0AAV7W075_PLEWA|nr:hypothetical protein NDU88_001342 [Pleurodeles waltl]
MLFNIKLWRRDLRLLWGLPIARDFEPVSRDMLFIMEVTKTTRANLMTDIGDSEPGPEGKNGRRSKKEHGSIKRFPLGARKGSLGPPSGRNLCASPAREGEERHYQTCSEANSATSPAAVPLLRDLKRRA